MPQPVTDVISRRSLAFVLGAVVLAFLAIPAVAFVIIPQLVRSSAHEVAPVAATVGVQGRLAPAPSGQAFVESTRTLAAGDLQQINLNDFGRGKVMILAIGSKHYVRFEEVEISGAPAQHVYLSDRTDGKPGTFTDLGPLRATNGSFNYDIPPSVDLASVKSVVSYCQQFKVTITYAALTWR